MEIRLEHDGNDSFTTSKNWIGVLLEALTHVIFSKDKTWRRIDSYKLWRRGCIRNCVTVIHLIYTIRGGDTLEEGKFEKRGKQWSFLFVFPFFSTFFSEDGFYYRYKLQKGPKNNKFYTKRTVPGQIHVMEVYDYLINFILIYFLKDIWKKGEKTLEFQLKRLDPN